MATLTDRLKIILDVDGQGAVREFGSVGDAVEGLGGQVKKSGSLVKETLAGFAGGLAAGGLVEGLQSIVEGYMESAEAAGSWAKATNASIADASKFTGLVKQYGLDFGDLLEIQAEFAQKVGDGNEELSALGVELVKNANGTVDWNATLVSLLGVLQTIPDATERNRLLFKYFGEEGGKQLANIVNSAVPVAEALDKIKPMSEKDIANQRAFAQAMQELRNQGQGLATTVGGVLVPVLVVFAKILEPIADALGAIPPQLLVFGAAALGLARIMPAVVSTTQAVTASFAQQMALMRQGAGIYPTVSSNLNTLSHAQQAATFQAQQMTTAQAALRTGLAMSGRAASSAGSALLGAMGGPAGLAVTGAIVGIGLALNAKAKADAEAAKRAAEHKSAVDALTASLDKESGAVTRSTIETLAKSVTPQQISLLKQLGLSIDDYFAAMQGGAQAQADFRTNLEAAARQHGATGATLKILTQGLNDQIGTLDEAEAQWKTTAEAEAAASKVVDEQVSARDALNQLVEAGITSGGRYAFTLQAATNEAIKEAQAQNESADALQRQIDVRTKLGELIVTGAEAQLAEADRFRNFQDAVDKAKTSVDDLSTSQNENAAATDAVVSSAISNAQAAVATAEALARERGETLSAAEANQVMIGALVALAAQPGVSDEARGSIQDLIDKLRAVPPSPEIDPTVDTSQADAALDDLDKTKMDPTVDPIAKTDEAKRLLDELAKQREAIVLVNLQGWTQASADLNTLVNTRRIAYIDVQLRGEGDVERALNNLARSRTSTISVQSVGPAPAAAPSASAMSASSRAATPVGGSTLPAANLSPTAAEGRRYVEAIRTFELRAGSGWRA